MEINLRAVPAGQKKGMILTSGALLFEGVVSAPIILGVCVGGAFGRGLKRKGSSRGECSEFRRAAKNCGDWRRKKLILKVAMEGGYVFFTCLFS